MRQRGEGRGVPCGRPGRYGVQTFKFSMSTLKKKQHYVWEYYLKAWTLRGKLYCYRQSERKLFKTGTSSIANETFFYKLERLSDSELKYVKLLIDRTNPPELRRLHIDIVKIFQFMFALEDQLSSLKLNESKTGKIKKILEENNKTLAENFHSLMEGQIIQSYNGLRNMECDFFLDSEKATLFINFLMHQFFRTPLLRDIYTAVAKSPPNIDLSKVWVIESHIYATNVGAAIFIEKDAYQFLFLENDTQIPFITADQPIINLNTQYDKDLRLYYPLSPRLALIFWKGFPPLRAVRLASTIEIEQYNQEMYNRSTDQIYSNNYEYLMKVSKSPKNLLR
jgi:hypothetical protein